MVANSNIMSLNGGPLSAMVYEMGYSMFMPKLWNMLSNYHSTWAEFSPSDQAGPTGHTTIFRLRNNIATYIAGMIVSFDVPPLAAGVGGTLAHPDFLGYAAVETITMRYGSNNVRILTGEEMRVHYDKWLKEKQEMYVDKIFGPLPVATREANYLAGVTVNFEIPFWFDDPQYAMPVAFGNDLEIKIKWRPASELIEITSGAPTRPANFLYENQRLKVEQIYATFEEQQILQMFTNTEDGLLYLQKVFQEGSFSKTPAGAGNEVVDVPLEALKNPTEGIYLSIHLTNELKGTATSGPDRFNYRGGPADPDVELVSVEIRSNDGTIKDVLTREQLQIIKCRVSTAPAESLLFYIPIGYAPQARNHFSGALEFGFATDPVIRCVINSKSTAPLTFQYYGDVIDIVQQRVGTLRSVFL